MLPSLKTGPDLGLRNLWFKDESMNPTGSFKARGMSVAVSKAKEFGVEAIALPSAGNAGGAAAAYAARGGLKCHVSMPRDTPELFISECRAYGASVSLVEGYITDASRSLQKQLRENNWFDVSTCKEPYRIEGKKTILFEIAQHLRWKLPDVIIFPTGGGTGIVAAWKAVAELQSLGWAIRPRTPRLIAVQSEGCAPIVRAYDAGEKTAREWENPQTNAWGLRVPKAVADFLILAAIRESQGLAIAVSEQEIDSASVLLAQQEGLFVAPEAAAGLAALQRLVKMNLVEKDDVVVVLLTGSGLKYVHAG
jgi:threonine synthase